MTNASWWWAGKESGVTAIAVDPLDPPIVVNPGNQTYYPGETISLRIENIGGPADSWSVDALPVGLSITEEADTYCIISGVAQTLTPPDVVNPGDQTWSRQEPFTMTVNNIGGPAAQWSDDGFPSPIQMTSSSAHSATWQNVDRLPLKPLDTTYFDLFLEGQHGTGTGWKGHGQQCIDDWDCLSSGGDYNSCGIGMETSMHYYDYGRSCMAAYYYLQSRGNAPDSRWIDYADADAHFWNQYFVNASYQVPYNRYFTGGMWCMYDYDPVTYAEFYDTMQGIVDNSLFCDRGSLDYSDEAWVRGVSYAIMNYLDYLSKAPGDDPRWTRRYPIQRDSLLSMAYQCLDECKEHWFDDSIDYQSLPGYDNYTNSPNLYEFSPFMTTLLLESLCRVHAQDETGDVDKDELLGYIRRLVSILAKYGWGTDYPLYRFYNVTDDSRYVPVYWATSDPELYPPHRYWKGFLDAVGNYDLSPWRLQQCGVAYAMTGDRRFIDEGDKLWERAWGSELLSGLLQNVLAKQNTQALRFSFDYLKYRGDFAFDTYFGKTSQLPPPASAVPPANYRPEIDAVDKQTGENGVAFSLQMTAKYTPTSWRAVNMPPGLSIDNAGLISGTPSQGAGRLASVFATNADGESEPVVVEFEIAGPPIITASGDLSVDNGEYYNIVFHNTGGPVTTWDVRDGWLPTGLSVIEEKPYQLIVAGTVVSQQAPVIIKPRSHPIRGQSINLSNPLAKGLMGYWPMLEGCGGTLHDYSGHRHHGTLTGMDPATDWVAWKSGNALDFDGVDDYAAIACEVSNPFTVMCWMLPPITNGFVRAVSLNDPSTDNSQCTLGLDVSGNYTFAMRNTVWQYARGGGSRLQWAHLAGVSDYSTRRVLYVDGQRAGHSYTDVTGFQMSTCDLGRLGDSSPVYSNVVTAHVAIYNRVLSPGEIQQLYADPWALFR